MKMNLPRPKLRLSTLLVLVAVAAMVFGVLATWRRRNYCLARAAYHASEEARLRGESRRLTQMAEESREARGREREVNQPRRPGKKDVSALRESLSHTYENLSKRYKSLAEDYWTAVDSFARTKRRFQYAADHPWVLLPRESEP